MADLSDESIEALWARHGQFSHDFAREVIAADRALNAAQPAPEPTDPTK